MALCCICYQYRTSHEACATQKLVYSNRKHRRTRPCAHRVCRGYPSVRSGCKLSKDCPALRSLSWCCCLFKVRSRRCCCFQDSGGPTLPRRPTTRDASQQAMPHGCEAAGTAALRCERTHDGVFPRQHQLSVLRLSVEFGGTFVPPRCAGWRRVRRGNSGLGGRHRRGRTRAHFAANNGGVFTAFRLGIALMACPERRHTVWRWYGAYSHRPTRPRSLLACASSAQADAWQSH